MIVVWNNTEMNEHDVFQVLKNTLNHDLLMMKAPQTVLSDQDGEWLMHVWTYAFYMYFLLRDLYLTIKLR